MDMNEALAEMVKGKKMVRPGWDVAGDTWLEMRQSDPPKLPVLENAYKKTAENTYVAWSGSVEEITATDWEERKDPNETDKDREDRARAEKDKEERDKKGKEEKAKAENKDKSEAPKSAPPHAGPGHK